MKPTPVLEANTWPVLRGDTPIIYEDDEEDDMGEANRHVNTNMILYFCLRNFLRERHPRKRVFLNMNCYYAPGPKNKKTGSLPYASADNMIVDPFEPLTEDTVSYTIGQTGPAPLVAIETLSASTFQENDLGVKVKLYADLKIAEYILVDVTGEFLPEKLLLKRLQPDGTWKDQRDADGGVSSKLGFRLLIDETGDVAVFDKKTGRHYPRPQDVLDILPELEEKTRTEEKGRKLAEKRALEAEKKAQEQAAVRKQEAAAREQEAEARRLAEERILALQAELERLRSQQDDPDS